MFCKWHFITIGICSRRPGYANWSHRLQAIHTQATSTERVYRNAKREFILEETWDRCVLFQAITFMMPWNILTWPFFNRWDLGKRNFLAYSERLVASTLVKLSVEMMIRTGADEVTYFFFPFFLPRFPVCETHLSSVFPTWITNGDTSSNSAFALWLLFWRLSFRLCWRRK